MKTIAYCRVSTDEQAQHGVSLAAQEQRIRQYCELYGLELIEVIYDPGYSAKNMNRPGVQKLIEKIRKKEISSVIVAKLDRLTRSVKDLAEIVELFNKKEASLVSVNEHIDTGTAAGRMILNMLGVISQWEREAIGERTSAALQYKKASGKAYNCNALYGFENKNGELIQVKSEQDIITLILHLREQNNSFKRIADLLNEKGIMNRAGTQWKGEQIRRIVLNTGDRARIDSMHTEIRA